MRNQPSIPLAQIFPGGVPQLATTPLLAAVVNKQRHVVEQLLNSGADPNHVCPRFGTLVHAATGAGDVKLLHLLINDGDDVGVRFAIQRRHYHEEAVGKAML